MACPDRREISRSDEKPPIKTPMVLAFSSCLSIKAPEFDLFLHPDAQSFVNLFFNLPDKSHNVGRGGASEVHYEVGMLLRYARPTRAKAAQTRLVDIFPRRVPADILENGSCRWKPYSAIFFWMFSPSGRKFNSVERASSETAGCPAVTTWIQMSAFPSVI